MNSRYSSVCPAASTWWTQVPLQSPYSAVTINFMNTACHFIFRIFTKTVVVSYRQICVCNWVCARLILIHMHQQVIRDCCASLSWEVAFHLFLKCSRKRFLLLSNETFTVKLAFQNFQEQKTIKISADLHNSEVRCAAPLINICHPAN